VVTLDGEVFSPQGAISGGFRKKGPGIVEQKLELEKQRISLGSAEVKIRELSDRLKISEDRETELSEKKEKLKAEVKDTDSRLNRVKSSLNNLNREMNKVCFGIEEEKKSLQRDWLERRKIQARCFELIDKISSDIISENGISELRVRLSKEENQAELLREKLKSCRLILERIRNEKDREQRDLSAKKSEIDTLRVLIRNTDIQLGEKGHLAFAFWKDLEKTKQMIRTVHETLKELASKLSFAQRRYSEVSELLRLIENDQNRVEQQKQSVSKDLDQLDEMWGDKFGDHGPITVSSVNIREVNNSIRVLEKKVRAFGAIDQGCLSEDQSLHERISYLEEQSRDVAAGTEELSSMIEGLDRQVETVFRRALKRVDDRFDLLFKRLFGGGEAHLTIQESDSIWDCGVDIVARPPGKKMQNLNQLSGGEQSLTAISLLFASMEVAEVPLAILDEVDAALDDVNLGRFVSLILDYAASLQLIIMTHRRITMEKASIMYGVTMKEPGLSQIVSVKLDDWS
jgi:chromosome segregation protein